MVDVKAKISVAFWLSFCYTPQYSSHPQIDFDVLQMKSNLL